jgi:hypothetical protein
MRKKSTSKVNKYNYRLKYDKFNADIRTRMEEVYYIWDHISKEFARDILKKMYHGEFIELKKISDRRLILNNLIRIEREIDGNTNFAKQCSKELLVLLEKEPEYIELNLEEYAKAINNYVETHKEELSKEELIERYKYCYNIYKDFDYQTNQNGFLEKLIAKYNLSMTSELFSEVLDIVEDLLIHIDNIDYEMTLQDILNECKDNYNKLYNQMLSILNNKQIKVG